MLESLPYDILVNILLRLPVKTLRQCICVCKSLCHKIADPFFVNNQLYFSHKAACSINDDDNNSSSHVIIRHDESVMSCYFLRCCSSEALVEPKRLESPTVNQKKYFRLDGSSNGLLCLLYCEQNLPGNWCDMALWNPSINKLKILPESQYSKNMRRVSPCNVVVGFAFVPHIRDFKVVRLVYKKCIYEAVEVYSLSTDSWRSIKTGVVDNLPCRVKHDSPSPFVNGFVHWMAYKRRGESRKLEFFIMSFHMVDEILGEVTLPRAFTGACKALLAFQGSLALFVSTSRSSTSSWDIWLMKDYGVVDSWTKQYSLKDTIGSPLEFMKNGDVILRPLISNLASYDPKTQKLRNLKVGPYVFSMAVYNESLALFNDGIQVRGGCSDII